MKTAVQLAKDAAYSSTLNKLDKRILLLAYLQFAYENPGLHPDDALGEDSGYPGWAVLLVDATLQIGPNPDDFTYPCVLFRIFNVLDELEELTDSDNFTTLAQIGSVKTFLEDFDLKELDTVIDCLEKLYLTFSDEDMTAEEESETACGAIQEFGTILEWVKRNK